MENERRLCEVITVDKEKKKAVGGIKKRQQDYEVNYRLINEITTEEN